MNILYISPYRNSQIQNECINNIRTLNKVASINISPIYINNVLNEPDSDIVSLELKNLCEKQYDVIIQHAPLDYLIPFKNVSKYNYCIPIISYSKYLYNKTYEVLLSFDMILADSKYDADFILSGIGTKSKKVKLFQYTNSYKSTDNPNLLHHKNNYKLYTFVGSHNISNLYTILVSFFIAYQDISNCSLILCAESSSVAEKINSVVNDLTKNTNIKYIQNYINILTLNNIQDCINIHETCDCYLELRSTTNSHLHQFIAKEYGNAFISNENLDINYEPLVSKDSDITTVYPSFSVSQLATKIKNIIRTKSIHKLENIPTLDKIICN